MTVENEGYKGWSTVGMSTDTPLTVDDVDNIKRWRGKGMVEVSVINGGGSNI